jgi:signal transduction histidine kinase
MSARERVAVVSPRPERREQARSWMGLLADRADPAFCASPLDAEARDADLVVVDGDCPDLDAWISDQAAARPAESILVFGSGGNGDRAAVPWGDEGAPVLALVADYLERRELVRQADDFLQELRESGERLESQRRRLSSLVVRQAEQLRGANASLVREVDELTRLRELARFFAASGHGSGFDDRLCEAVGAALAADGAALCESAFGRWEVRGRWRLSSRGAERIAPDDADVGEHAAVPRPSPRKGRDAWWLPVAGTAGLAVLVRADRAAWSATLVDGVRSLVAEGLATRASTEALLFRKNQSDRILQTLRGGLLKVDGTGRIALANPACAEILETTVASLEGRTIDLIFPPAAREALAAVSAGAGSLDDVETFLTTGSGRSISVSLRASALRGGENGDEILVLISDLSRRKEVEAEVRRVDRLSALGRLSAGVAHEIRNPLAGIRTTAEILRGRLEGDEELRRFVDVMLEETARLDRIVGSLLQFAKPAEPRREPLDLGALLERARQLLAGRAAERRITLRVGTVEAARPLADRDQILQVVLNLVLNGIEASPEGAEVRMSARASAGGSVEIAVEDDGPGVAATVRERIFDPFFTTKPGGTGLGLSISQNIIARHGGSLRVEGSGPGTRAVVVLPQPRSAGQRRTGGGNRWPTS